MGRNCDQGKLDQKKVNGKIVVCKEAANETYIKSLGGIGVLISVIKKIDTGFTAIIPEAYIDSSFGNTTLTYVNSTK